MAVRFCEFGLCYCCELAPRSLPYQDRLQPYLKGSRGRDIIVDDVSPRPQAHDNHELFGLEALVPARVRHVQGFEDNVAEEGNDGPDRLCDSNRKRGKGVERRWRIQRAANIIPWRDVAHRFPKVFELGPEHSIHRAQEEEGQVEWNREADAELVRFARQKTKKRKNEKSRLDRIRL